MNIFVALDACEKQERVLDASKEFVKLFKKACVVEVPNLAKKLEDLATVVNENRLNAEERFLLNVNDGGMH